MRATYMYGAGDVRVIDVPDPAIKHPADALVRVVRSCVCGSDLHPYHSMPVTPEGASMGHECIGVVEDTGSDVTTVKKGDLVIAPFAWSDGTCDFCREGPADGVRDAFLRVVRRVPGVTVAIHDTPENIMQRITFYDIDSRRIEKHLTEEERRLYLKEIKADISYFKRSYERADLHVTIAGLDPEASAAAVDARLSHT